MNLKELKEKIDEMYNKYGDVVVTVDISKDEELDDCVCETESYTLFTDNIQDVTELKDSNGEEVTGICISNYIMEDNNWGKDD